MVSLIFIRYRSLSYLHLVPVVRWVQWQPGYKIVGFLSLVRIPQKACWKLFRKSHQGFPEFIHSNKEIRKINLTAATHWLPSFIKYFELNRQILMTGGWVSIALAARVSILVFLVRIAWKTFENYLKISPVLSQIENTARIPVKLIFLKMFDYSWYMYWIRFHSIPWRSYNGLNVRLENRKKNILKIANGAPNLKTTRQLFSPPNMAGASFGIGFKL